MTDDLPEATPADLSHLFGPELLVADPAPQAPAQSVKSKATAQAHKFDPKLGLFIDAKTGKPVEKKLRGRPKTISRFELRIDMRSVFDKAQDLLIERVVNKDADGYHVGNAGRKRLSIKPRSYYRKGTYFRVVGENVRMEAMCNYGDSHQAIWSGFARVLEIGTIVECIGWRRFRKNGLVAPQFHFDGLPREARYSQIWPLDSVWRPWPLDGILEPLTAEELADYLASREGAA